MSLYPGELVPWLEQRFLTADGTAPLSLGTLETYQAGTSTPLQTFADANLTTANPTTINLDAGGRPTVNIFLSATGYKFVLKDSTGAVQYTMDLVENVGQTFAQNLGSALSAGGKNVTSGYTVLATDRLVTVSSTGGPTPCVINLPSVASATQPLCIKNMGTIALAVTPNGSDLIENVNTAYTVTAASGQTCPSIWLVPYPSAVTWFIVASHKL